MPFGWILVAVALCIGALVSIRAALAMRRLAGELAETFRAHRQLGLAVSDTTHRVEGLLDHGARTMSTAAGAAEIIRRSRARQDL